MTRRSVGLLTFCSFITLLILLGLGTWQVQRLQAKNDLIARVAERTSLQPLSSASEIDETFQQGELDFRRLTVEGHLSEKTARLGYKPRSGVAGHDYIALLTSPGGKTYLVDLGWAEDRADIRPPVGERVISGIARDLSTRKPGWFTPEADIENGLFYSTTPAPLFSYFGASDTMPVMIHLSEPIPDVATTPNEIAIDYPNNHLSYAITWYGIALGLVGVYLAFIRGVRRPDDSESDA